jgi:hypothetical protein
MVRRGSGVNVGSVAMVALMFAGCSSPPPPSPVPVVDALDLSHPGLTIPPDVQRLAVVYPRGINPEWSNAYSQLEGAAFQLKAHRPTLRIIDRSHMPTIFTEQRFQAGGLVSDETAVRIGQMLGVDSVLIYRIDGPTLRDRLWARQYQDLPPITVTSKIIRVENAEVVYHNVVTARVLVGPADGSGWSLSDSSVDYQRWSRDALDRGIKQTVVDLRRAFQ